MMLSMTTIAFHPRIRERDIDGGLTEIVIWQLDAPVPPCTHCYKYRLVYVVNGDRVVGYDNERGKGDHRHIDGEERPYTFTTPERLLADFQHDVERWRGQRP